MTHTVKHAPLTFKCTNAKPLSKVPERLGYSALPALTYQCGEGCPVPRRAPQGSLEARSCMAPAPAKASATVPRTFGSATVTASNEEHHIDRLGTGAVNLARPASIEIECGLAQAINLVGMPFKSLMSPSFRLKTDFNCQKFQWVAR